ncbi:MAG: hypothetical protein ICV73_23340 [Acetobacteraceae bacterium]|nr:hypothetical protein [Acetobacteraceae bacterium]
MDGAENANGAASDPHDPDAGPNNLQNKPVLTAAATTTVQGRLNSPPRVLGA